MTDVAVKGLEALKRRLDARDLAPQVETRLRQEAEQIATDAAASAPGRLGETIDVVDEGRGDRPAFAVGTAHRAGRFLEYGTVRRPATPWLWPVFRARLPRIKHALTNTLRASLAKR